MEQIVAAQTAINANRKEIQDAAPNGALSAQAQRMRCTAAKKLGFKVEWIFGEAEKMGEEVPPVDIPKLERSLLPEHLDNILQHPAIIAWDPRNSGPRRKVVLAAEQMNELRQNAVQVQKEMSGIGNEDLHGATFQLHHVAAPTGAGPSETARQVAELTLMRLLGKPAIEAAQLANASDSSEASLAPTHNNAPAVSKKKRETPEPKRHMTRVPGSAERQPAQFLTQYALDAEGMTPTLLARLQCMREWGEDLARLIQIAGTDDSTTDEITGRIKEAVDAAAAVQMGPNWKSKTSGGMTRRAMLIEAGLTLATQVAEPERLWAMVHRAVRAIGTPPSWSHLDTTCTSIAESMGWSSDMWNAGQLPEAWSPSDTEWSEVGADAQNMMRCIGIGGFEVVQCKGGIRTMDIPALQHNQRTQARAQEASDGGAAASPRGTRRQLHTSPGLRVRGQASPAEPPAKRRETGGPGSGDTASVHRAHVGLPGPDHHLGGSAPSTASSTGAAGGLIR
jgi:hypothetical protein